MSETAAMTLTDFLLARIAEDEADPWRGAELIGADRIVGRAEAEALAEDEREWEARVLAECEAKRRIVEVHPVGHQTDTAKSECGGCVHWWPRPTLRALAVVYADHPDCHEEWKP